MNQIILYYILGILTVYIVLPIIDSILAIILTLLELIKGVLTLGISKINYKINQLNDPIEKPMQQIGFVTNSQEEVEGYDSEA